MKAEVRITKSFKKALKPLAKKYPSLIGDLAELETKLLKDPRTGVPLGNDAYKIRLRIKSKGKGKSGGARVISFVETELVGLIESVEQSTVVNLITIYDKAETGSISNRELRALINALKE